VRACVRACVYAIECVLHVLINTSTLSVLLQDTEMEVYHSSLVFNSKSIYKITSHTNQPL